MLKTVKEKLAVGIAKLAAWVVQSVLASAEEDLRTTMEGTLSAVLPRPNVSQDDPEAVEPPDEPQGLTRQEELEAMGMPAVRKLAKLAGIRVERNAKKNDVISAMLRRGI